MRMWNYFNDDGPCKNNHVKVTHMQKKQATTEVTIEQQSGGRREKAKKRKVVRRKKTIKKLMEEFTGGIRTQAAGVAPRQAGPSVESG